MTSSSSALTGQEFPDAYAFLHSRLLPCLFLETILIGMLTVSLFLFAYKTCRSGIVPLTTKARGRITRVAVLLVFYIMIVIHWALSVKYASELLFGVWLGLPLGYINGSDVGLLYYNFGPIILECVLFGMFCTLSVVSVYVFMHKNWRTRSHQIMLAVSLLMFTISLVHLALQMLLIAAAFRPFIGLTPQFDNVGLIYMPIMLVTINVIIGDGIVLWRMCALCHQNVRARLLAFILFSPTVTVCIANLAQEFAGGGNLSSEIAPGVASLSDFTYGTAVLALSLATNMVATLVIARRAWLFRKSIAELIAPFKRHSIVEKVMSLLIESGTIYCVIWALYIVDSKSSVFELSRDTVTQGAGAISSQHFTGGAAYFSRLMAQVTGIYPTIILVIVALEKDHVQNAFSESKLSSFVAAGVRSSRTRSTLSLGLGGRAATRTYDARSALPVARVDVEAADSRALPPNMKRPTRKAALREAPSEIPDLQSLHTARSGHMRAPYQPSRLRQHITMPAVIPHQPRPVRLSSTMSSSSHSSPTAGSAFMSSSRGISPRSSTAASTKISFVGSAQLLRDAGRQDGFEVLPFGAESKRTSIVDELV